MIITERDKATLLRLAETQGATFVDLVQIAGLDPGKAFRGADLRGVDFAGSDLSGFDFTDADLTGASFLDASVRGATLDGALLKNAAGIPETVQTQEQASALSTVQIDRARWILCGFGRAAQTALRSREILSRPDILVLPYAHLEAFGKGPSAERSGSLKHSHRLMFVCDPDRQSIKSATDAALVAEQFLPSLAVVYRPDRSSNDVVLPSRRLKGFVSQAVIVDSHAQVFRGRARFTLGRLVRSYLDTLDSHQEHEPPMSLEGGWSVFSLGSHPKGVQNAVAGLEHAIAASVNPLIDTLSADNIHMTIMSVGRPTIKLEDSLRGSVARAFDGSSNHTSISWRKLRFSGSSVPVQVGLLARGLQAYSPSDRQKGFFKAIERTLSLYQGEWERRPSAVDMCEYSVQIHGNTVHIVAAYEENIQMEHSRPFLYCVPSEYVRKQLYRVTFSETDPILLLNEIPFVLQSNDPFRVAMHVYRLSSTRNSLRNEFADDIDEHVRSRLLSEPSSYSLYQPLQDLSSNTVIDDVEIEIETAARMADFAVKFTGSLRIYVNLDYGDSDVGSLDSYPGHFECVVGLNGPELISATADTSSFYGP